ncbi:MULTISPECIES: nucleotide exchange factor GrpE [Luteimonas]|uniref:Protein GrpE n=1 Tax=Luteimonas chenhongjianii TaxID=2006110 RepID=A0A290XET9_9GAMM|nr:MULTISPECIES: nucleotide exchange factor GrpE [Luteimonas]ATD67599.1 nucleotide exchange factor GrpE [Luteimonas chenhongjianii]RPD88741.1 nucleotide exchange factor GrpE [Luteimonas sp. 100069]
MTQPQHDAQTPNIPEDEAPEVSVEQRLAEQVELVSAELEQLRAQVLLERADLENQRKRLAREVENARRFANERLLAALVPVFDALEAGLASAPEADPLRNGVELTLRELTKATESNGLATVAPAPGDAFNPEHHQAMSVIDAPGVPGGAVAQVFQKGYLLNERLLRPAMVVVAKAD